MGERPYFIKPAENGTLTGHPEVPDQDVIERYEKDLRRISEELVD